MQLLNFLKIIIFDIIYKDILKWLIVFIYRQYIIFMYFQSLMIYLTYQTIHLVLTLPRNDLRKYLKIFQRYKNTIP